MNGINKGSFPVGSYSKESTCNAEDVGLNSIGKIPWRRAWRPTLVFLPGGSHGRRRLIGYSPWGCKQLDTTEQLHFLSFLLLGRKVMTNLDSIFKSRDITLPTKVRLVKAMVFPVVIYGCESWTVKKAEH